MAFVNIFQLCFFLLDDHLISHQFVDGNDCGRLRGVSRLLFGLVESSCGTTVGSDPFDSVLADS